MFQKHQPVPLRLLRPDPAYKFLRHQRRTQLLHHRKAAFDLGITLCNPYLSHATSLGSHADA